MPLDDGTAGAGSNRFEKDLYCLQHLRSPRDLTIGANLNLNGCARQVTWQEFKRFIKLNLASLVLAGLVRSYGSHHES